MNILAMDHYLLFNLLTIFLLFVFYILLLRHAKRVGLPAYALFRLSSAAILVGILIARIFIICREPYFFLSNPLLAIYFWEGLSLSGFFLGAIAAFFFFSRAYDLSFFSVTDGVVKAAKTPVTILLILAGYFYFAQGYLLYLWLIACLLFWSSIWLLMRYQRFAGQLILASLTIYSLIALAFSFLDGGLAELYLRLALFYPATSLNLERIIFALIIFGSCLFSLILYRRALRRQTV